MDPSGPILYIFSVGAVSIVTADSLLVPGIAARGERRMCSGIRAEKLGPRFFHRKHMTVLMHLPAKTIQWRDTLPSKSWEVGKVTIEEEAHFSTRDVDWTFLHIFFQ